MIGDFRMNRELAEIGGGLNSNNPDVRPPDTTPGGANEADVMTRMQIVFRKDRQKR